MLIIGWFWFQSPNIGYPDTKLWPIFRIMYYGSLMDVVPPLSPPTRFPRPSSMSPDKFPTHAYLSPPLSSSPSVFRLFVFPPSSAGCHPPSARPDWRPVTCCPWCSSQCPDVCGFSPPTCAAGGTWLGCRWWGVGDVAPPDVIEVLNASCHTVRN